MSIQQNILEWDENDSSNPAQSIEHSLFSDCNGVTVNGKEAIDYLIDPLSNEPNYPAVNLNKMEWGDLSLIDANLESKKVSEFNSICTNIETTKVDVMDMDLPPPILKSWDWWLEKVGVPLLCALITGSAVLIGNLYN